MNNTWPMAAARPAGPVTDVFPVQLSEQMAISTASDSASSGSGSDSEMELETRRGSTQISKPASLMGGGSLKGRKRVDIYVQGDAASHSSSVHGELTHTEAPTRRDNSTNIEAQVGSGLVRKKSNNEVGGRLAPPSLAGSGYRGASGRRAKKPKTLFRSKSAGHALSSDITSDGEDNEDDENDADTTCEGVRETPDSSMVLGGVDDSDDARDRTDHSDDNTSLSSRDDRRKKFNGKKPTGNNRQIKKPANLFGSGEVDGDSSFLVSTESELESGVDSDVNARSTKQILEELTATNATKNNKDTKKNSQTTNPTEINKNGDRDTVKRRPRGSQTVKEEVQDAEDTHNNATNKSSSSSSSSSSNKKSTSTTESHKNRRTEEETNELYEKLRHPVQDAKGDYSDDLFVNSDKKKLRVVIVGGGVIGASCAYYLRRDFDSRIKEIIVVEQERIGAGASGRAGGFIAKEWQNDTATSNLAHLSWDLHLDLNRTINQLEADMVTTKETGKLTTKKKGTATTSTPSTSTPSTKQSGLSNHSSKSYTKSTTGSNHSKSKSTSSSHSKKDHHSSKNDRKSRKHHKSSIIVTNPNAHSKTIEDDDDDEIIVLDDTTTPGKMAKAVAKAQRRAERRKRVKVPKTTGNISNMNQKITLNSFVDRDTGKIDYGFRRVDTYSGAIEIGELDRFVEKKYDDYLKKKKNKKSTKFKRDKPTLTGSSYKYEVDSDNNEQDFDETVYRDELIDGDFKGRKISEIPKWAHAANRLTVIGEKENTAQCTPKKLTELLIYMADATIINKECCGIVFEDSYMRKKFKDDEELRKRVEQKHSSGSMLNRLVRNRSHAGSVNSDGWSNSNSTNSSSLSSKSNSELNLNSSKPSTRSSKRDGIKVKKEIGLDSDSDSSNEDDDEDDDEPDEDNDDVISIASGDKDIDSRDIDFGGIDPKKVFDYPKVCGVRVRKNRVGAEDADWTSSFEEDIRLGFRKYVGEDEVKVKNEDGTFIENNNSHRKMDVLYGDIVILCMGPWTYRAIEEWGLTGLPTIKGMKAHSLSILPNYDKIAELFKIPLSEAKIGAQCIFGRLLKDRFYRRKDKKKSLISSLETEETETDSDSYVDKTDNSRSIDKRQAKCGINVDSGTPSSTSMLHKDGVIEDMQAFREQIRLARSDTSDKTWEPSVQEFTSRGVAKPMASNILRSTPCNEDFEIYPRPDGTVYMCGYSEGDKYPEDPGEVKPTVGKCEQLYKVASRFTCGLSRSCVKVERSQACYLPIITDAANGGTLNPAIGKVPRTLDLFVAAGHSVWGIHNSLGTGRVMAETIMTGQCKEIDLTLMDPSRNVFEEL